MHHLDSKKTHRDKFKWGLRKSRTWCLHQILEPTTHKTALSGHLPPISHTIQVRQDTLGTAGKVRTNSSPTFSYELLHRDAMVLADKEELTVISTVRTQDGF